MSIWDDVHTRRLEKVKHIHAIPQPTCCPWCQCQDFDHLAAGLYSCNVCEAEFANGAIVSHGIACHYKEAA